MDWKVTALHGERRSGIGFRLTSTERVTVGDYSEMEFAIAPVQFDLYAQSKKWELNLTLRNDAGGRVADERYVYNTLTEATADAEALAVYLHNATNAPGMLSDSVHTHHPKVQTV